MTDGARLEELASPLPEYLDEERVRALGAVPSSIRVTKAVRQGGKVMLDYEIDNPGKDASLTLYHGSMEGLTLEKKWEENQALPEPRSASGSASFLPKGGGPCYLRLLLKNEQGQFWTWETTVVR